MLEAAIRETSGGAAEVQRVARGCTSRWSSAGPSQAGSCWSGQAPGDKEPLLGRPFAWTAGKTLFKWFAGALGWSEEDVQKPDLFCGGLPLLPGKASQGRRPGARSRGDRGVLPLARAGIQASSANPRDSGRQARDLPIPRAGAPAGPCRQELQGEPGRAARPTASRSRIPPGRRPGTAWNPGRPCSPAGLG